MSSRHNLTKMFSGIERAAGSLLSAGQTQDAMVLLASESILRAHFETRVFGEGAARQQTDLRALGS